MKPIFPYLFSFFLLLSPESLRAQLNIYSFEALDTLQHSDPRPVVVFFYTDWCRFCRAMEQTTFKNKKIIQELNNRFYFLQLNAEERKDIYFQGRLFSYRPTGMNTGEHELAAYLTQDGYPGYPALSFLNSDYSERVQVNRFLAAKELLLLLESYNNKGKQLPKKN